MSNKQANIANKIVKRAHEIQDSAYNYFATIKILDGGDKLRKEQKEAYVNPSNITVDDLQVLAKTAESLLDKELMKYSVDSARDSAIGLAVKTFGNGKYDGKIGSVDYFKILNLMNKTSKVGERTMKKTAQYYTKKLDTVANDIHKLVVAKVISAADGYAMQVALDEVSDALESRTAKTLENGTPEQKYMDDFGVDPATREQDADESYMKDFHNFGQNIMGEAMKAGEFKPEKKVPGHGDYNKAGSLNAAALAEKRK